MAIPIVPEENREAVTRECTAHTSLTLQSKGDPSHGDRVRVRVRGRTRVGSGLGLGLGLGLEG